MKPINLWCYIAYVTENITHFSHIVKKNDYWDSLFLNQDYYHFSYTFERVQENSEKLWRFQRYTVINDYDWRIPSPLNIAFLPYRLLCCPTRTDCCLHWCKSKLILRYLQRKSLSFLIFYSSTYSKIWQRNSVLTIFWY